jgi:hypothetical protein
MRHRKRQGNKIEKQRKKHKEPKNIRSGGTSGILGKEDRWRSQGGNIKRSEIARI